MEQGRGTATTVIKYLYIGYEQQLIHKISNEAINQIPRARREAKSFGSYPKNNERII